MNAKNHSTLGTLDQQRNALPQLIYREGVRVATPTAQAQRFGMAPAPSRALEASISKPCSAQVDAGTPVFLRSEFAQTEFKGNSQFGLHPGAEAARHPASPSLPIARILRMLSLMGLLALGGCAGFTQPMTDLDLRAESASCANSALCRTFIEDRPPVLAMAVNDARLCETNARVAESILKREGVSTRRFVVRLKPVNTRDFKTEGAQSQLLHTFVAANVNQRWYAVDNGSLPFCNRVCRLSEALHGVELISGDTKSDVSVGAAVVASR